MDQLESLLRKLGPTRSGRLAEALQSEFGLTAVAARKRVSRAVDPIKRLTFPAFGVSHS